MQNTYHRTVDILIPLYYHLSLSTKLSLQLRVRYSSIVWTSISGSLAIRTAWHKQPCKRWIQASELLKYYQIISVLQAVLAVPSVSGARLRLNLCLADSPSKQIRVPPEHVRPLQNRVYKVHRTLMAKSLDGEDSNSFGALATFPADYDWSECFRRHNDPTTEYPLAQFELVGIGS